ncbi:KN motif and ankyrin repeat domain-containing protein 4 isoform X2 [Heteronotia binoei]|uniref:KN motif and ankyrin repeat domain-containing protein 4 isoform X2 n=1 Tax=Heteronotia binoei TaxID=13085 RepID=UPI002931EEE6|nr:KN motif and ankyrin repeat domain-containing protein 4 isoform X2 [Heteronotia binoei]
MENMDGDWSSKTDDKDPPQSPYSVETPYGFHLDLDFLKYVDDIEKGNTIKRIPIHRKAKHPKFSTLPRNFSLPENGSKAYSSSQSRSFLTQRKASLGTEESTLLVTSTESSPTSGCLNEPSYRRKALLTETIKQDSVNLEEETSKGRGRPQLLRASSMPATLPPIQNSEEDQLAASSPPLELFQSMNGKGLEFDFTPAKEPLELDNTCGSSLMVSENIRIMKPQNSMAACARDQENTILELDKQEVELLKERIQLSVPWQNQHLRSEELLVVTKNIEEHSIGETSNSVQLVQSVLDSSRTLEYTCESQSQEETELNVCGSVPEVLKKDEVSSLGSSEMKSVLHPEALTDEEPSKIIALKQHIAILEEQLNNKTEELEQIRVVLKQQDKEIKAKERSIELLASSKAQLEKKLYWESTKDIKLSMQANSALQYNDAAVNTEIVQEKLVKGASDKGINVSITMPKESVGYDICGADMNMQLKEISKEIVHANHESANTPVSDGNKNSTSLGIEQNIDGSIIEIKNNEQKINEHSDNNKYQNEGCQCGMLLSSASAPADGSCSEFGDAKEKGNEAVFEEDLNEEESHPERMNSPADPSISQYVKKIQDLLQEQWMCLEHGYPELASAIKQPASKLSSIQNQLVNSLNLLLSAYSTQAPTDKENSNTECQQLEISPSTSLKSIMKKKDTGFHAGGNSTKKNLQFVGVNGGYETTSSEDSSCEESSSEENSNSEPERKYGSEEHRWGEEGNRGEQTASGSSQYMKREVSDSEELESARRENTQHKTERFKPSADFLKGCQILTKNLSEIRTTKDKLLKHVLSTICQEWFRISSRKSSSPEIVAVYLQEVEDIHPQLQNIIVNLADGNGNTALHYSVSHSNFRIVKLLLETGVCDVDHQNKAGYTAVMITPLASAETDEEMEVVTKLLKEGNVNIRASQGGQTALILGVSHDREDMVKALLSCGADVNLQDDSGLSPLMVACQYGNVEIVKLLLFHPSCNIELTDKAGNSALSIALKSAHIEIAEFLQAHI